MIVRRLELCWRYIADWLQQPTVIEPVDPFERRVFHGLEVPPRTAPVNKLGLVKSNDRLGKCVVVRIAHAAYRRLDSRFGQSLGVANRQILATAIAVMHDPLDSGARPQRLLQRVQDQFGVHRARHAPADDAPGEHIDHKRDVNEACPRREWSERPGVVELSPGLSSPNRTYTSQRIRLSIQVLLKAKATSAECTSPACLAFHRLSKVFTLLQPVNPPCKPLKLPPFAMWPAFPASDYYEGSVNLHSIGGHTPLASVQAFPSSHAGLITRARLPIAVFILACRKSSRTPRSSYARSVAPCRSAYISARICRPVHTYDRHRSASCP